MQSIARYFAPAHLAFVLIFLIGALSLSATTLILVDDRSYEQTIAAAKALATEGSWAKARDAYTEALPLAPDADARRWCELWIEDATWRSEMPSDWQGIQACFTRNNAVLNTLLKPYAEGLARDEFWMASLQSRAELQSKLNDGTHWIDRLEIADYLATQAPTAEAARRYVEYLQTNIMQNGEPASQDLKLRWLEHLAHAAIHANSIDDRGWFTLRHAQMTCRTRPLSIEEHKLLWQHAFESGGDSIWAQQIHAGELIARVLRGRNKEAEPMTKGEISSLLAEIDSMSASLARSPSEPNSSEILNSLVGLRRWWTVPLLQVDAQKFVQSGEPFIISYGTVGYEHLTVELYRHSLESWSKRGPDLAEFFRMGMVPAPQLVNAELLKLQAAAQKIYTVTIPLAGGSERIWQNGTIAAMPAIAAGFYTVVIRGEDQQKHEAQMMHIIASSAGAITVTPSAGPGSIFVFDRRTGQPVANAELSGIVDSANNPAFRLPIPATKTNADGLAQLPPLLASDDDYQPQYLNLLANDQPLFVTRWPGNSYRNPILPHAVDVFVDRKLFRPGETVHWKVIARNWRDGRFIVPSEKPKMSVQLHSNKGEMPLFEADLTFDLFGTAHGEFTVPQTTCSGSAFLNLTWPEDKNEDPYGSDSVFMFCIDNFVPPAVTNEIELVSTPDSLRPGQVIRIRSIARYLSGGSVSGCPVTFALSSSNVNFWSLSTEQQHRIEEWKKDLEDHPRKTTTDASGNAEITVSLPTDLLPGTRIEVEATLTPEGGQAVGTSISWNISKSGINTHSNDHPDLRFVRPGDTVVFSNVVQDGRGYPYRFEGRAQLVEKKWFEAWLDPNGTMISGIKLSEARQNLHPDSKGNLPAPWKKLHAGYVETPLVESRAKTDENGEVKVSFLIPHAGLFALRLKTDGQEDALQDVYQRQDLGEQGVIAADETTASLDLRPNATVLSCQQVLHENEPLRLNCILPEGQHWALIAINGDERALIRRVSVSSRVGFLEIADLPRFTGKGVATIVALETPSPAARDYVNTTFKVEVPATHIDLTINPSHDETRPGATTTVRIQTKNSEAPPEPTQIAFAVTDESVNQLFESPGRSQLPFHTYSRVVTSLPAFFFQPKESLLGQQTDPRPGACYYLLPLDVGYLQSDPLVEWLERMEDSGYSAKDTLAGTRFAPGNVRAKLDTDGVLIRTHFDSTAFWSPDVVTNEKGEATVSFKYPDNLTQWRLEAYAVGADGNSFGRAATFTRTSLPFQARLQLPRFLVAGDTAEPSALLLNRTDADFSASAELKLDGAVVATDPAQLAQKGIPIPKQGEAHTAWNVKTQAAGTAEFTLTGRAGTEGDAMMLPIPVLEDGIQQLTAASGRLAPDAKKLALKLSLPAPLDPQRTHVTLQLSPSHAAVVLDALPYLVDYPYGCVEQTMSRFLPAVIAQKTLTDLGLDAAVVEQRILAGETTADAKRRTGTAGLAKIDDVVQKSLGRLIEAQSPDDGFGWWPGATSTNLWMTAYVAWGLGIAKSAGVTVPADLETGTWRALTRALSDEAGVTDEHAWALAALANAKLDDENSTKIAPAAFARVYAARERLSATGRACLAQASPKFGSVEQRAILLRNLENGAVRMRGNDLGDTVHWGRTSNYWNAMDGAVETTSLTLLALLELDPKHPLIEPAMNWLVLNRRSAHWQSTRDSAFAVLALTRYIAQHHELGGNLEVEVFVSGKSIGRVELNRDSVLKGTTTLEVPASLLHAGTNTLTLKRVSGTGPLYAVALASAWATGDTVKPAGHMVDVARNFVRHKAEPTLIGTLKITPQPMPSGGSAVAGEQVTATVTLTMPNDLEYVMVEVPKPAGCEPLNPLSGWDAKIRRVDQNAKPTKDEEEGHAIYREERDDKSVFFLDKLEAGTWEIRFGMRAVTPGDFRALPVQATAMYVPEITANSDAQRVKIHRAEKTTGQ